MNTMRDEIVKLVEQIKNGEYASDSESNPDYDIGFDNRAQVIANSLELILQRTSSGVRTDTVNN